MSTKNSSVRGHNFVCDNIASFKDFPFLAVGSNELKIKLQESILIRRDGSLSQPRECYSLMAYHISIFV